MHKFMSLIARIVFDKGTENVEAFPQDQISVGRAAHLPRPKTTKIETPNADQWSVTTIFNAGPALRVIILL